MKCCSAGCGRFVKRRYACGSCDRLACSECLTSLVSGTPPRKVCKPCVRNDEFLAARDLDWLSRAGTSEGRNPCGHLCPPAFRGCWQDWHRGSGCGLDDGQLRTETGAAEITALGVEHPRAAARDPERS